MTQANHIFRVVEFDDQEQPLRVHQFTILDPETVNPTESMNAMSAFENITDFQEPQRFKVFRPDGWKTQIQVEERWEPRGVPPKYTRLPVVEHHHAWQFFRSVNYDAHDGAFRSDPSIAEPRP